jgi:hypothetical protein
MHFSILSIQKRKLYILASEIEAKTERTRELSDTDSVSRVLPRTGLVIRS